MRPAVRQTVATAYQKQPATDMMRAACLAERVMPPTLLKSARCNAVRHAGVHPRRVLLWLSLHPFRRVDNLGVGSGRHPRNLCVITCRAELSLEMPACSRGPR